MIPAWRLGAFWGIIRKWQKYVHIFLPGPLTVVGFRAINVDGLTDITKAPSKTPILAGKH